jgi:hypothetical protein
MYMNGNRTVQPAVAEVPVSAQSSTNPLGATPTAPVVWEHFYCTLDTLRARELWRYE